VAFPPQKATQVVMRVSKFRLLPSTDENDRPAGVHDLVMNSERRTVRAIEL